jgi:hypothetical protein
LALSQSEARNFVCFGVGGHLRKVGFACRKEPIAPKRLFLHGIGKYRGEYSLHQG